jgi:hypothetical protein
MEVPKKTRDGHGFKCMLHWHAKCIGLRVANASGFPRHKSLGLTKTTECLPVFEWPTNLHVGVDHA